MEWDGSGQKVVVCAPVRMDDEAWNLVHGSAGILVGGAKTSDGRR